jgi:hypothetical protein
VHGNVRTRPGWWHLVLLFRRDKFPQQGHSWRHGAFNSVLLVSRRQEEHFYLGWSVFIQAGPLCGWKCVLGIWRLGGCVGSCGGGWGSAWHRVGSAPLQNTRVRCRRMASLCSMHRMHPTRLNASRVVTAESPTPAGACCCRAPEAACRTPQTAAAEPRQHLAVQRVSCISRHLRVYRHQRRHCTMAPLAALVFLQ